MKLLAFSGSTRKESLNSKLINEVVRLAKTLNIDVTVIHLENYPLPFFDEDLEKKVVMPDNVKLLRQLIMDHDGTVISSPEYNSSISAVLKNTIDWLSRDHKFMKGRKVMLTSCSPSGYGGSRGLKHLTDVLNNLGAKILDKQLSVPSGFTAFDKDDKLVSETHQNTILEQLKMF
ncbi:MAG: NADPH-dependent oxidoreductase [Edafosvirus sp.]|uniref:NADPH-dependent oxidoreductase n=1 Tax=Edafosvirus sp. TaxID=2487765 RepID=A0A3G4ZVV8_9VIRU|nr:MAG: NADPH-dependent oxidoreductase [Edafosvirus sp.]